MYRGWRAQVKAALGGASVCQVPGRPAREIHAQDARATHRRPAREIHAQDARATSN